MSNIIRYGNWPAVINSELIATNTLRLSEPQFDGGDRYWLESRPKEKGRTTIVRLDNNNQRQEMVPTSMNVRTHAHEYGGGCYCVDEGVIYLRITMINVFTPVIAKTVMTKTVIIFPCG
jgi:hypothetical protein